MDNHIKLQSFERLSGLPYVKWIRKYNALLDGSYITSADGGIDLVVLRRGAETKFIVSGPTTKARAVEYWHGSEALVISLNPSVYMPALPPEYLLDIDRSLPQIGKQSFWLQSRAWTYPSFENADDFVAKLMQQGVLRHDALIAKVSGRQPVDLTLRSVQRRFRRVVGFTPHYLYQIQRAERSEMLLAQGISIGQVASDAGYNDQSSMTHALKYFIGRTPGQIRQNPDGWR